MGGPHSFVCVPAPSLASYVYWSSLERNFFDGKTADFVFMLLCGSCSLLVSPFVCACGCVLRVCVCVDAPSPRKHTNNPPPSSSPFTSLLQVLGCFVQVPFLGYSLVFMVVYIWSRHNLAQIVPVLWFAIPAPWLPYFLAVFSLMLGGSPTIDLLGILVGHLYYSFREVLPKYLTNSHDATWLPTPAILCVSVLSPPCFYRERERRKEEAAERVQRKEEKKVRISAHVDVLICLFFSSTRDCHPSLVLLS